jgi:hypothetical protein
MRRFRDVRSNCGAAAPISIIRDLGEAVPTCRRKIARAGVIAPDPGL